MKYGYSSTAITITLILLILTGIMFAGCNTKTHSRLERENRMLNSPQFKDGKFVNPIDVPMMAPGSTWKYIKKQFFTSRIGPKPKGELPLKPIQSNEWIGLDKSDLFFAWLGHSSILITMDGKTIYHAGDTGLFYDMKLIGEMNDIDLAFLPIGDNFTMGVADAVKAVEFLNPKIVVPIHYKTWPIIDVEPTEFADKLKGSKTKVIIIEPGNSLEF